MAHELSLLFKDWVKKVPAVKDLYRRLKNITIWIRNHGDILILFEEKVKAEHPGDKRKWTIQPYMPGDTRMGTVYKLAERHSACSCNGPKVQNERASGHCGVQLKHETRKQDTKGR